MYDILELKSKSFEELLTIAQDLEISKPKSYSQDDLVYKILDEQAIKAAGQPEEKHNRRVRVRAKEQGLNAVAEDQKTSPSKKKPRKKAERTDKPENAEKIEKVEEVEKVEKIELAEKEDISVKLFNISDKNSNSSNSYNPFAADKDAKEKQAK